MRKIPKPIRTVIVIIFWICIWWILSLIVNNEVLIPTPLKVLQKFKELCTGADFYISIGTSILRIIAGFFGAVAAGVLTGILCAKITIADEILLPVLSVIRATPVASFIILALVFINKEIIPVAIAFLMVFPVIHGNIKEGILNTDGDLLEMVRFFKVSKKDVIFKLYVPQVFPFFFSGIKTCLGLAWKAGVAAEVLCFPIYSIGKNLYYSKVYLETDSLFAWTIVIVIISIVIEKVMTRIIEKNMPKEDKKDDIDKKIE